MGLLNPEQLTCSGCGSEVVEVVDGWVHLDGSLADACGDEIVEVAEVAS